MSEPIQNTYEPKSVSRVIFGVISAMLSMGLPIGLTELIRPGGDLPTGLWGMAMTAGAIIFGWLSIRGTLTE